MTGRASARDWAMLATLGVIWGASFMFVTIALESVGPLLVVAARITLGALFLLILTFALGHGLPDMRTRSGWVIWGFAFAMGVFSNALPFALLTWGQQWVASGFAGVCMAVVPLLVLPLAHVFVPGEWMTLRRTIGFLIGTVGVIVLIGPQALSSSGDGPVLLAQLACVAAAGCYAVGSICTRLCPEVDRLALAAATLLVAAVIFTPYALLSADWPEEVSRRSLIALIYLGLLPTGVAQILLVQVIRNAGPTFMSLVNYQVPLWSVVFGAVILSEPLPPSLLTAMVLILGGVGLSQLGTLKRLFAR